MTNTRIIFILPFPPSSYILFLLKALFKHNGKKRHTHTHTYIYIYIYRENYFKLPFLYTSLQKTTLCKFFCKKLPYIIHFFAKDYLLTVYGVWPLKVTIDHHVLVKWGFNPFLLLHFSTFQANASPSSFEKVTSLTSWIRCSVPCDILLVKLLTFRGM